MPLCLLLVLYLLPLLLTPNRVLPSTQHKLCHHSSTSLLHLTPPPAAAAAPGGWLCLLHTCEAVASPTSPGRDSQAHRGLRTTLCSTPPHSTPHSTPLQQYVSVCHGAWWWLRQLLQSLPVHCPALVTLQQGHALSYMLEHGIHGCAWFDLDDLLS